MVSGAILKKIVSPIIKTKGDAYKFESGRKGLSKQILEIGKEIIVVGKDGKGYEKEEWNKSKTFWQSKQENLLVADNQTNSYLTEKKIKRHLFSYSAWGKSYQAIVNE